MRIPDTRRPIHLIRLLAPPLLPHLDIPSTRAATAQSQLHQPCEDRKSAGNPHEGEHSDADLGGDVDFCHAADGVAEDDEHDGCDDGGGGDEEGVEEGEDGDGEAEPASVEGEGHQEDEDEGEDGSREEEAEHPLRGELDEVEDVVDVGGEVDCGYLISKPST